MKIYCDEPIIAVYKCYREYDDIDGADEYFNDTTELAYHVTEGHRRILETENFYISISSGGVVKSPKTCTLEEFKFPGEKIENQILELDEYHCRYVDYESTLFIGERLVDVEMLDSYYLLHFSDFDLKLVPHNLNENLEEFFNYKSQPFSYQRVLGAERLITSNCHCGGSGELLLDFVYDYVVRCKDCKQSTFANSQAYKSIELWNEGDICCDLSDIVID